VIDHFSKWMDATLLHLKNDPFEELANYPDLPPYKNPNAQAPPDSDL
jgi:hypothetical protein